MSWRWSRLCALLGGLLLAAPCLAADALLPGPHAEPAAALPRATTPGERAVQISARFLGTPYAADTLGGGAGRPEQLTVRPDAVDCFTLLDYIEALRRADSPGEFRQRLIEVRYRDGVIAWSHRRHFFTDWAAAPEGRIVDVTASVGGRAARQVDKELNCKDDGQPLLAGVACQRRVIRYLPASALDDALVARLRPGDYLGSYSPEPGLDVSHVGLLVEHDGKRWLRHASSRPGVGRVIDSELHEYFSAKPGLIVLRPQ